MPYALQPLVRIRAMREDSARAELVAARRELAAAEAAVAARRRDFAAWEATKDVRRDRIYATVMGRPVSRDQLDMANEGVARIDEEGALKADNVVRAETERRAREEAAEAARVKLNQMTKNRMKIDEHKAVWAVEDARAQELRAEGELEDFNVRKEEV